MSFRGINTTVIQIRRQVFTEVARMAYANVKGEKANHLMRKIPYTIIPGEEGKLRKEPDPAHAECGYGGQQICRRDARAQRNDRENHAHSRFSQRTVQSVKQEQAAYAAVKCAFNAQIAHAFRNHLGFFAIYEKHHQRFCESVDVKLLPVKVERAVTLISDVNRFGAFRGGRFTGISTL